MTEFIVIVESGADARTATKLAERILVEKVNWLEPEILQHLCQWSGLKVGTDHSCWKNIVDITQNLSDQFKFPTIRSNGRLKTDGKAASKVLKLISFLQYKQKRQIKAVLFIRDLDNQPERRKDIEQARSEHINEKDKLEIVIGTADRMREAWVLNGFIPSNQEEERILEELKSELKFDPCLESHRLRERSLEGANRIRHPKVVVEKLTGKNMEREQQCWEETSLELLRERGVNTGLTDYIREVEQRLSKIILFNDDNNTHTATRPEP